MKTLSIAVPVYNEEEGLPAFFGALSEVLTNIGLESEVIFVDDGSSDGSLAAIRKLAARDRRVRYISFSRNFGKEAAMLAGLRAAKGDLVAVMDADGQDPPEMLPEMRNFFPSVLYNINKNV